MSKKDYQAIARALWDLQVTAQNPDETRAIIRTMKATAEVLADVFAASNPRFDRSRFMEACETGKCKGMR